MKLKYCQRMNARLLTETISKDKLTFDTTKKLKTGPELVRALEVLFTTKSTVLELIRCLIQLSGSSYVNEMCLIAF